MVHERRGPVEIIDAEYRTPSPAKKATAQAWDTFDTEAMVQEILAMNNEKADHMKWRAEFEFNKTQDKWKRDVKDILDKHASEAETRRMYGDAN